MTEFMRNLIERLEKENHLSKISADYYVNRLRILNEGNFNNLSFLKETKNIIEKIKKYAQSTQSSYLASIVSQLSLYKTDPEYKPYYDYYYTLAKAAKSHINKVNNSHTLTETQEENWKDYDEIKTIRDSIDYNKNYDSLLQWLVLSLYIDIPPRRSKDFYLMNLVWKVPKDGKENYLDWKNKRFIFRDYKTKKTREEQIIDIPKVLLDKIIIYVLQHPLIPQEGDAKVISRDINVPFLVFSDGSPLREQTNKLTRLLNKAIGKKISVSMLRHIYLSSHYDSDDVEERENTASAMAHGVGTQSMYVKKK